jgi:hypothetical protein
VLRVFQLLVYVAHSRPLWLMLWGGRLNQRRHQRKCQTGCSRIKVS